MAVSPRASKIPPGSPEAIKLGCKCVAVSPVWGDTVASTSAHPDCPVHIIDLAAGYQPKTKTIMRKLLAPFSSVELDIWGMAATKWDMFSSYWKDRFLSENKNKEHKEGMGGCYRCAKVYPNTELKAFSSTPRTTEEYHSHKYYCYECAQLLPIGIAIEGGKMPVVLPKAFP